MCVLQLSVHVGGDEVKDYLSARIAKICLRGRVNACRATIGMDM